MDLVTLEQAKLHIVQDGTYRDGDVQQKVTLASAIILKFIKMPDPPAAWALGTSPETYDVPADVQAAVLLAAAEMYENRESSISDVLAKTIKDLLSQYWDPAMA